MDNIEVWEKIFQDVEWGKYPSVPVIRFIARNFYKTTDRSLVKILEVGAGTGANLWFCAKEGFKVFSIEGSRTATERMNQRFAAEGLSKLVGETLVGDYYDKLDDFPDNYFDGVIDSESLYCNTFDKSKVIVTKIFDKLKSGGVMMSLTFADGTFGTTGEECDYHAVNPTEGPMAGKGFTRYTTKSDIDELYKRENNVVERVERQEYWYNDTEAIKEWVIELKKV